MVGLLASPHKKDLQGHSVRLFKHGMRADLHGGTHVDIGRVRRYSLIDEFWSRYAVCNKWLVNRGQRSPLAALLGPALAGQLKAAIRLPHHPGERSPDLATPDLAVFLAPQMQHRMQTPKAVAQQHHVPHRRSIAGHLLRRRPTAS